MAILSSDKNPNENIAESLKLCMRALIQRNYS